MVDFSRLMFRPLPGHDELLDLRGRAVVVSVSGSREGPTRQQLIALSTILRAWACEVVVHGDCVGVDEAAHHTAHRLGMRSFAYPSDLDAYRVETGAVRCCSPMAPTSRNRLIVQAGHVLVAVPRARSRGTWDAVEWAVRYDRPTVVITERGRATPRERWQAT